MKTKTSQSKANKTIKTQKLNCAMWTFEGYYHETTLGEESSAHVRQL